MNYRDFITDCISGGYNVHISVTEKRVHIISEMTSASYPKKEINLDELQAYVYYMNNFGSQITTERL
ncbi:hypothetical protein vBSauHMpol_00165 [Staphylococcus phage vB_SauH-Mpol]|nr:hypothetical protein vBSauHMpol_00165 [Staphylococcus phage vB_SauH-Mpol]